jgi:hypothetical protein
MIGITMKSCRRKFKSKFFDPHIGFCADIDLAFYIRRVPVNEISADPDQKNCIFKYTYGPKSHNG